MIGVLLVTAIVLLDQNGGVSLGLLLPLTALVAPVRLLDHSGGMIEFPLLAVGQRQPAQIRLAAVAVPGGYRYRAGTEHTVQLPLAAAGWIVIARVAVAVKLQLQLQELAKVGRDGRRGRRVRRQAAARRTGGTGVGVGVRDRRGAAAAVAIRVEQLSGVERLQVEGNAISM